MNQEAIKRRQVVEKTGPPGCDGILIIPELGYCKYIPEDKRNANL